MLKVKDSYGNLIVQGSMTNVFLRNLPSQVILNNNIEISNGSKILGSVYIEQIIYGEINNLWKNFGFNSLMPWNDFKNYFQYDTHGYVVIFSKHKKY